ncbi:hypothetical protein KIPB_006738, partial [Kipferlia bialata]
SCYDQSLYLLGLERFRTAAVPVLSGEPFPIPGQIYYPLVPAVHVMLSSIRAFLERGENMARLDLLILVAASERERAVLQDLLQRYFPRDTDNETEEEDNTLAEIAAAGEAATTKKAKKGKKKGKKGKKGGKKKKKK